MPLFKRSAPAAPPPEAVPRTRGRGGAPTPPPARAPAATAGRVITGERAPAAAAARPPQSGTSSEAVKTRIAGIRENMLQPLGQMLDHAPSEDMAAMVDMYLHEAQASLETLQEQMMHVGDEEVMMMVVGMASEFQELQGRAEAWKGRSGASSAAASSSASASASASTDEEEAALQEALRLSAEAAAQERRSHEEAARQAAAGEQSRRAAVEQTQRQAEAERQRARQLQVEEEQARRAAAAAVDSAERQRQEEIQRQRHAQAEEEARRVQEAEAAALEQANLAHEEAMRRAREEEAAMLHRQMEADRKRKAEEAHAQRMQEEADRAERAAKAAAAAAQAESDSKKRQEALAEQQRQEKIQRQRHDQAESEAKHAHEEAARLAAEEEAHFKRLEEEAAAAERAAAQAAASAANEHDERRRAEVLAEGHRQQELARQKHAQAEEERLHAQMLRREQSASATSASSATSSQAVQQVRLAEAEAMLRETLGGAGRNDVELLEYAVNDLDLLEHAAREATDGSTGAGSSQRKKLLKDGKKQLSQLKQAAAADKARKDLEAAITAPKISVQTLKEALACGSKAAIPEAELAGYRSMLDSLAEQEECGKELEEAMHGGDPARLHRAIERGRKAGMPASTLKLAERNHMAVTFLAAQGGGKKGVILAWRAVVTDTRTVKKQLADILLGDSSAEAIDDVVAKARELEVDDRAACDNASKVAQQRRLAHDQVVCALVTGDLQEIEAAKRAVQAAGGPGTDLERIKLALQDAQEDEIVLQELDKALPAAVQKYLKAGSVSSPSQRSAGLTPSTGSAAMSRAGPPAVAARGFPVAVALASDAPPSSVSASSSSPIGTRTAAASSGGLMSALFGVKGSASRSASPSSLERFASTPEPAANTAANHQEMKSKVERARQWVHSQDRAHKASKGLGAQAPGQPAQMPSNAPTLRGQGGFSRYGGQPLAAGPSSMLQPPAPPFYSAPVSASGRF